MHRWNDIFTSIRGWFPLTWSGVVSLGLALYALLSFGIERSDYILGSIGALVIGVVAVALLFVTAASLTLWLTTRDESKADQELNMTVGEWSSTGFSSSGWTALPGVTITVQWVTPFGDATLDRRRGESVRLHRRGWWPRVVRRWRVEDALGLCAVSWTHTSEQGVAALPGVGALDNFGALRGLAAGDMMHHPEGPTSGDPYDMRHYAPGDPIRLVLWRVYARTREVMVRSPERALSPVEELSAHVVISDTDGAAAGAARILVERAGPQTDYTLTADGTTEAATDRQGAYSVLRQSGLGDLESGGDIGRFIDGLAQRAGSRGILMVSPTPGSWLPRTIQQLHRVPGRVDVFVCYDHVVSGGREWLRSETPSGAAARSADLETVVSAFEGIARHVYLLDRRLGKSYPASALRKAVGT